MATEAPPKRRTHTEPPMKRRTPTKRRAGTEERRLSSEDMLKVLELLKGATSVELKLMVPDQNQRGALQRLGLDPVEAEPRQTFFFDTPDLALNKAGVIVRARRSQGGKADTVVKLRPIDPAEMDPSLRRDRGFKIELDAMPGGYVCSASLKGLCTAQEVFDVTEGKLPLESIFTRKQRAFYTAHAPAGIEMNNLVPLGPTFLLRLKDYPMSFDRRLTVELWLYPDGSRILEISTKGEPAEAFQLAAQFRAFMAQCGFAHGGQESKTSSALRFFSKHLTA